MKAKTKKVLFVLLGLAGLILLIMLLSKKSNAQDAAHLGVAPIPSSSGGGGTTGPQLDASKPLSYGMSAPEIVEVQKILNTTGIVSLTTDGALGPNTAKAISDILELQLPITLSQVRTAIADFNNSIAGAASAGVNAGGSSLSASAIYNWLFGYND